jgi:hypothetical protein
MIVDHVWPEGYGHESQRSFGVPRREQLHLRLPDLSFDTVTCTGARYQNFPGTT